MKKKDNGMRTLMQGSSIMPLFWILLLSAECTWGQTGAYYHVVSPYEGQDVLGHRMGGVTVALPDEVPQVLGNPAGLAYIDRSTFFFSMSRARSKLDFTEIKSEQASSHAWSGSLAPGYAAVSLPLKLFRRPWVVAAAYNGRQSPEFDESYVSAVNELITLKNEREGHIGSASLGIGVQLVPNLSLGIGWTRWFGELKWRTVEAAGDSSYELNRQTSNYIGSGWQAGIMGQVGRLSLGAVIYFPQKLMTAKGTLKPYSIFKERSYQENLKFSGALKGGAAYHFKSGLALGVGYSYQLSFVNQYKEESYTFDREHGSSTRLTGGIEYTLNLKKVRLPLYFGYQACWMPEFHSFVGCGLLGISRDDQQQFQDKYSLGAGLIYGSVGLHLTTQWAHSSLQITDFYLPAPS